MRYCGVTDIGKVRKENQDKIYLSDESSILKYFIIADGMGGVNGGEIASKIAVESIKEYIDNALEDIEFTPENISQLISEAILVANEAIFEKSNNEIKYKGMGTTIIIAIIFKNRVYIGHVGDSRIYRIRKNIIRQLTKDHSYVQALYREGTITKEEAENHPQKNILLKVVGCEENIEPDIMVRGFIKDDILLLCTDGLTNMVDIDDIYDTVMQNRNNLDEACKKLISMANDNGRI